MPLPPFFTLSSEFLQFNSRLNGPRHLGFRTPLLVAAAVQVGASNQFVLDGRVRPNQHLADFYWRGSVVGSALDEERRSFDCGGIPAEWARNWIQAFLTSGNGFGELSLDMGFSPQCAPTLARQFSLVSPDTTYVDPSEKGLQSYVLGMAHAQMMLSTVARTPFSAHVDVLLKLRGSTLSGSRPDLVAVRGDRSVGVIVESKGYRRTPTGPEIRKAKMQAQAGVNVGVPTVHRVAAFAYFSSGDGSPWRSKIIDPPQQDDGVVEFDFGEVLLGHYAPLVAMAIEQERLRRLNVHEVESLWPRNAEIQVDDRLIEIVGDLRTESVGGAKKRELEVFVDRANVEIEERAQVTSADGYTEVRISPGVTFSYREPA